MFYSKFIGENNTRAPATAKDKETRAKCSLFLYYVSMQVSPYFLRPKTSLSLSICIAFFSRALPLFVHSLLILLSNINKSNENCAQPRRLGPS